MLEAAEKAMAFCRGMTRKGLEDDEKLQLALVRLLEILGEAAKKVSQERRDSAPDIPWREIAATRDRLIHGYFDVDLDVVWAIVAQDLPGLAVRLRGMIEVSAREDGG
jgi:uncharacterized protein with HEPN domain